MHDILLVLVHAIVTIVRLRTPGGLRAVVAESALTRHQLLILNRSRNRDPNLRVSDRIIAGLCTLLMHPARMLRCGIVLKPSTLLSAGPWPLGAYENAAATSDVRNRRGSGDRPNQEA
jgi:hypothetical protein